MSRMDEWTSPKTYKNMDEFRIISMIHFGYHDWSDPCNPCGSRLAANISFTLEPSIVLYQGAGAPQRSRADPGEILEVAPQIPCFAIYFWAIFEPYISEDIPIYSRCSWGSQFTKWDAPPSWRPVAFQDGSADFSERCCWFVYLYLIDVIWTLQPNFWYPMLIDKSSNFDFLHVR
jgi:hypothetical protein